MAMGVTWLVRVYNEGALKSVQSCPGPVELGRQDIRTGEEPYQLTPRGGGSRLVIAPCDDLKVSRRHARLEEADAGRVAVRNDSESNPIVLEDGHLLRPHDDRVVDLPVVLAFGATVVRVQPVAAAVRPTIESLDEPTIAPGGDLDRASVSTLTLAPSAPLDVKSVFEWLRAMLTVLQSAATDGDFFRKAAWAAVEVAGMDMGRVLTRAGSGWTTAAAHPESADDPARTDPPSRLVLNRVLADRKVSWLNPSDPGDDCPSLAGVSSVVAAPILARSGEVIGVLYGQRRLGSRPSPRRPVTRLDAMIMEVLAVGLAAGLARIEQERAATAMQARFEQFFTPELARHLAAHPELLDGKDLEITVLFADLRDFSRITRRQPPAFTVEWTQDVLSTLSECVLAEGGVLVDYIGDEVMAMWGAPEDQPDHAERACRAAREMVAALEGLDARWRAKLGEPISLGIGINTGTARVGNTGSRRKFKYGPLGDTVNVASRVQGAAKYFKSSLLITRATRDRLGPGFSCRRLGGARVVNIAESIELFELMPSDRPGTTGLGSAYEEALAAFEAGEFRRASRILGRLLNDHEDDGPSIALLARAVAGIVDQPEAFDPAFRLPGK